MKWVKINTGDYDLNLPNDRWQGMLSFEDIKKLIGNVNGLSNEWIYHKPIRHNGYIYTSYGMHDDFINTYGYFVYRIKDQPLPLNFKGELYGSFIPK